MYMFYPTDGYYNNGKKIKTNFVSLCRDNILSNQNSGIKFTRENNDIKTIEWDEDTDNWKMNNFPLALYDVNKINNSILFFNNNKLSSSSFFKIKNNNIYTTNINDECFLFSSTTQGMLLPRMTSQNISNIQTPVNGLFVYDTSNKLVSLYNYGWNQLKISNGTEITTNKNNKMSNKNNISNLIITNDVRHEDFTITFNNATNPYGFYKYSSIVTDGKYLYFTPYADSNYYEVNNIRYDGILNSIIVRYNLSVSFNSDDAYEFFNLTAVSSNLKCFYGSIFDGRYIYFIPTSKKSDIDGDFSNTYMSVYENTFFVRYDTTKLFTSASSYEYVDLSVIIANLLEYEYVVGGYTLGSFDGKYIYLTPYFKNKSSAYSGNIYYNTTLPFTEYTSYAINNFFDTLGFNAAFFSCIYDGSSNYYLPGSRRWIDGDGIYSKYIIKYDNEYSSFTVDLDSVLNLQEFTTSSVYDGRFIYMAPFGSVEDSVSYESPNISLGSSTFLKYDTELPLDSPSSYSIYDTTNTTASLMHCKNCIFDGRYIWLMSNKLYDTEDRLHIIKYDTTKKFTSSSSYIHSYVNSGDITDFLYFDKNIYTIAGSTVFNTVNQTLLIRKFKAYEGLKIQFYAIDNLSIATCVYTENIVKTIKNDEDETNHLYLTSESFISLNSSNSVIVGDTTSPSEILLNIKNETKGVKLPKIEYTISLTPTNGIMYYKVGDNPGVNDTLYTYVNNTWLTVTLF